MLLVYVLEAFKHFAAAAERGQSEDWPDAACKNSASKVSRDEYVNMCYVDLCNFRAPKYGGTRGAAVNDCLFLF
jgi:hypothetical protein